MSDENNKASYEIIQQVFGEITDSLLKGKIVKIRGFGTFKISKHKARTGRNPKTGEQIMIPAKKSVKLNISKDLKMRLQK